MFAVCGYLSSGIVSFTARVTHGVVWEPYSYLLLPIPFALLCAGLFPRMRPAEAAVPLMVVVFPLAFLAEVMSNSLALSYLPSLYPRFPVRVGVLVGCVGGLVGGFTLTLVLCFFMCVWRKSGEQLKRLLSAKYLFGGAVLGFIGAIPLELNASSLLINGVEGTRRGEAVGFSIWQMLVGTYLHIVYTYADRKAAHQKAPVADETVPE
jgi:hypothetical protein